MFVRRVSAAAFAAALVVFVWWGAGRVVGMHRAEVRQAKVALARDSVEAAADTSRHIHMDVGELGDSLRVFERRALQVAQRADALDRALARERVLRDRLEVTIAALRADAMSGAAIAAGADSGGSASGSVSDSDAVRRARFDLRQEPYTLEAQVALPRPPERGRMHVEVRLDTLALELRVGCGAAGREGVRPASVNVVAPAWASVRLGRVEQAPEVCGVRGAIRASGRWASVRRLVERVGVSVGYSAVRTPSGTVVAGAGVGLGLRIWP